MPSVFLVTSGEYSDYGIDAVFSTKEKAEAYATWFNTKGGTDDEGWEYRVEEYELDRPVENLPGRWRTVIDEAGNLVPQNEWWDEDATDEDRAQETTAWLYGTGPARYQSTKIRGFLAWGKTKEHARRSAEELRRQTLALEGKVIT